MAGLKRPDIGRKVSVTNPALAGELLGVCTEHLSTQWVIRMTPTAEMVIHKRWDWRYV